MSSPHPFADLALARRLGERLAAERRAAGLPCRLYAHQVAPASVACIRMTFAELMAERPWKPIRDCPGRYVLPPSAETPATIAGGDAPLREYQLASARDPIIVAAIAGGGIISYRRPDGRFVHTLNTPEGFARKLQQLGIVDPE